MEEIYSFVMKGELTKVALDKTKAIGKYSNSEIIVHEYINIISDNDDQTIQELVERLKMYLDEF